MSSSAPIPDPPPARREAVEKARQAWIRRLIDLSRRNNLLYYRPLKSGTLDLSLADPERWTALLSGDAVNVSRLAAEGETPTLSGRVREIGRRALANAEERGLQTLFVALGMATWPASDGGRPPDSPVLLLPVALEARGRGNVSFSLRRSGLVQVNLVLLHVLEAEMGVRLSPDDLLPLLQGDDEGEVFDPAPVYRELERRCAELKGFSVRACGVLGNFAFQKMAMVKDLQDHAEELARHELVAGIAGDPEARRNAAEPVVDVAPGQLDEIPADREFLILDSDSSQHRAIESILAGSSSVIHGPPGTGKSQTIANLIASMAAAGRRVLFVAEKRAALEVVLKRLADKGLGHMAIDLHGADVSPRSVMEQIARALETVRQSVAVDCEGLHQRFEERRRRLNEHAERVHRKRSPAEKSVYELQGHLLRTPDEEKSAVRWRGADLDRITAERAVQVRDQLRDAAGFSRLFLGDDPSPWNGAVLDNGPAVQGALDLVTRLSTRSWPKFIDAVAAVFHETSLRRPRNFEEAASLFKLVAAVQQTLKSWSPEIFENDPAAMARALERGAPGGVRAILAWCLSGEYRAARNHALKLRTAGPAPISQLFAELRTAGEQAGKWRAASDDGDDALPEPVEQFDRYRAIFDAFQGDLSKLQKIFPARPFGKLKLEEIGEAIRVLKDDTRTPHQVPRVRGIERALNEAGVAALVEELRRTRPRAEDWPALFDHAWYTSALERAFSEDPELGGFSGRSHDRIVEEFVVLDRERVSITSARVRRAHAERAIAAMNANPQQEYLVRGESQKVRRHLPLRRLFADAGDVLTVLCPCWMASPLSVSQLLDGGRRYFDYVIFDEASQVLPEDAVPSLLRGQRAVVAGDSHQLPPTTFFAAGETEELVEDEQAAASEGFESLLDMMNAFLPSRYLEWHYRSRDESLITFSNQHIYDNRLVTFPGPGGPAVISHELVTQEVGSGGQEESNWGEVRRVVELVLEHAARRPHESLGVIAMGIRHADRVQRALDDALEQREDLDAFFDATRPERFFVKNLERVQGDERDAILLTVGYGKDSRGNLPFRFGPLLPEGGRRRLNVAVTRARRRLTLVSSFSHLDMDPGRVRPGTGVELLRNYLQYAAGQGKRVSDADSGAPLDDFESDVLASLTARGLRLVPQVGASRFRIELVAVHPNQAGRFVLAIECDGDNYRSGCTARERDRLRQQQLESLGWKFHRIWSTDWYMRKNEEIERAVKAYETAVRYADELDRAPATPPPGATQAGDAAAGESLEPQDPPAGAADARPRGPRPPIPPRESISQYTMQELVKLVRWVNSDGHLRTDEELIDEMIDVLGFSRRGSRIEATLRDAIRRSRF